MSATVIPMHGAVLDGREPLISFRGLDLDFAERPILRGIDLNVAKGEFVCVVGPSGCGKTTLLRLLGGLVPPTRGEVRYDGRKVSGPARNVAIVFQDYGKALLPWRNVAGNVSLALEAAGLPRAQRPHRIAPLLKKVGLEAYADRYPAQLSGGMQQRLQIARCLAQEPAVLLMDEPFGALDGMTVLFVTHDLDEAIYLGDRVVALRPQPGRIAATFEVKLSRPRDQLATRESPEFLRLRRALFDFIQDAES
jgi:NitT/TauT family transport system ATP-binding protein